MSTKKSIRRTRTQHQGVKLKQKKNGVWVARWIDPDKGTEQQASMDKLGRTTHEMRVAWCKDKSRALLARRAEKASGVAPKRETLLAVAVEDFFAAHPEYRKRTASTLRSSARKLLAWAEAAHVRLTEELTPQRLSELRKWLVTQPAKKTAKGGRRGEKETISGKGKCAPPSINRDLASWSVILHEWRRSGFTPKLTTDDIKDAVRKIKTGDVVLTFLRQHQVAAVLSAAIRHDAACFKMTRDEHDGRREKGSTPKYEEIAAFTLFVLLSGCRFEEAVGLPWTDVDLEKKGHGEIYIPRERSKTKKARWIDLEVTPALRSLLAALKVRAGGSPFVFGERDELEAWQPRGRGSLDDGRDRLIDDYGAPEFTWQDLRQTCGTFLVNGNGLNYNCWRESKQLGHSVTVAEKHYLGRMDVDPKATTLEAALEVEEQAQTIIKRVSGGRSSGIAKATRAS